MGADGQDPSAGLRLAAGVLDVLAVGSLGESAVACMQAVPTAAGSCTLLWVLTMWLMESPQKEDLAPGSLPSARSKPDVRR